MIAFLWKFLELLLLAFALVSTFMTIQAFREPIDPKYSRALNMALPLIMVVITCLLWALFQTVVG